MKRLLALLIPALLCLTACTRPLASIRNPEVYENELDYNKMVQEQGATHLRYWLSEHCTCDADQDWVSKADNEWSEECEAAADWILVVETREPWHRAMALYNGSLLEEKPPENPPEIPPVSALCPGEEQ